MPRVPFVVPGRRPGAAACLVTAWPLAAWLLTACAHAGAARATPSQLGPAMAVMNGCAARELLVVENRTGYPVRVTTTDGTVAVLAGNTTPLRTVVSGAVDTIPGSATVRRSVQFDLQRPAFLNGQQPPIRGLEARCVPAV